VQVELWETASGITVGIITPSCTRKFFAFSPGRFCVAGRVCRSYSVASELVGSGCVARGSSETPGPRRVTSGLGQRRTTTGPASVLALKEQRSEVSREALG